MAEEKGVQLLCEAIIPDGPMKNVEEIEESIRTTYRKTIWTKFIKAINDFNLIEDGDKNKIKGYIYEQYYISTTTARFEYSALDSHAGYNLSV